MDSQDDLDRAATDLARFALASHAAGRAMRREDVRALELPGLGGRGFKAALERASRLLEESMGLAIVALPMHERQLAGDAATQQQQQQQQQQQSGSKAPTRWVLQNALPDAARERVQPVQSEDEAATLGFAAAVLSLVFVNNMSISNDQLALYVRRLGPPDCVLPPGESRDAPAYATAAQMDSAAQTAIAFLVRRGYLDRLSPHASAAGETQAQHPPDGGDAEPGVEYTWGPQAKVRFEPLDMARFIAAMTEQECTPEFVKTVARAYGRDIPAPAG
ncbi:hypothetical protein H4R18_004453 [Coemansia javaensis]|uniref:MAGE domain-containing protein n=1 Tax=Coemansia javaensis TaxID=2761396 RepID=A0A9W8LH40_9FUNG|nr:hypothetical protein H4R18_004453 [Coemansia javaensis]